MSLAIIIALFEGPRSIKIMRLGQNPLPNEKVFKKTKYKYGGKAKIQPVVIFCSIGLLFVFSIWGSLQAYKITQDIKPCKQQLTNAGSGFQGASSALQKSTKQLTLPSTVSVRRYTNLSRGVGF